MRIQRARYFDQLQDLVHNSPITALLGPRLMWQNYSCERIRVLAKSHYFDPESTIDSTMLQNSHFFISWLYEIVAWYITVRY